MSTERPPRPAPALAALALAGLCLAGCYDGDRHTPTESNLRDVITLQSVSGATSLPADGFSRLRIEARLLGDPALDRRTVLFATSLGTLEGGSAEGDAMAVVADDTGRARIDLVAGQTLGTAVVTAAPKAAPGITASLEIAFVPPDPDGVVRFVAAPARAPADGATLTTFTVEVSPELPAGDRTVSFSTTAGTFAPQGATTAAAPVEADARASVDLQSPVTLTSARVTATVEGVTRSTTVHFERAPPDAISVAADPLSVPAAADSEVTVTATLHRDLGSVTDGTIVTFRAVDDAGDPVGTFANVTLSSGGTATAVFQPRTTTPGFVTVIVGAEGTSVTGSVRIELTADS